MKVNYSDVLKSFLIRREGGRREKKKMERGKEGGRQAGKEETSGRERERKGKKNERKGGKEEGRRKGENYMRRHVSSAELLVPGGGQGLNLA